MIRGIIKVGEGCDKLNNKIKCYITNGKKQTLESKNSNKKSILSLTVTLYGDSFLLKSENFSKSYTDNCVITPGV